MNSSFPPELLERIFTFLPRKLDQIQCLQVCKAWYHPARKQLFEHVTLQSDSHCNQFWDLVYINKMIGRNFTALVKHITIDIAAKRRAVPPDVISVIGKCSNILKLDCSKRTNPYYILRTIESSDESLFMDKVISMNLSRERRYSPAVRKHYMSATLKHKNTMQDLTIYADFWGFEEDYRVLHEHIHSFTKLESLVLNFGRVGVIDLHGLLQSSASKLVKLELDATGKILTSSNSTGLENMMQITSLDRAYPTATDSILEPECQRLTKLKLRGLTIDLDALEFIMENCPNLQHFQLFLLCGDVTIAFHSEQKKQKMLTYFGKLILDSTIIFV